MSDILKISEIMTRNLISFSLDTPLSTIVKSMEDKKISSIVITENNKPMGIITERDIVKATLSPERNLKKMASSLMSSPVFSINENLDYRDAYMQMTEHKIRHLVVVDVNEDLIGMLSESDFLRHLNPEQLLAIKEVSKVMTTKVLTCKAEDSVYSVLEEMTKYRIGGIIVEENDKPIGVISERDAVKLIQKNDTVLKEAIKLHMSSPVFTVHKNQTVLNAQSIMENSHIRRLVVVDDDEKIAGIITRHDLVKSIPEYYVEILREMIDRQKKLVSKAQVELDEKTIFQNAMKSLPHNLVFMTNKDGLIQFINNKESQICKVPEIKTGTKIENLDDKLFDVIKGNKWKDIVKKGETLQKIVKVPNKFSKFSYFYTSISPVLNTENEFEGFMYIARDISHQQTLEKELKSLNDNLQEAYKVAKIGNWELDAKTFTAFWSNEICDICGLEANSKGGPDILKSLVDPEDFEKIEKSLISSLETGSLHELVYEVFPKNGAKPSWVECRARRELDEHGNPKSLVGTLQDVTKRVKAEKRIEHLNSLLKAIRNINQLIVKEKDIEILMPKICNEITIVEKFRGVWIFLDDYDNTFYSSGFDNKSINTLKENISEGNFPSCFNIKDKLQAYKEPQRICVFCPLSQSYENTDAVVVPIRHEETFYGHICFSIGNNLIEDDEEKELVQEIANDIAFSIFTINERKVHKAELENSHKILHKLTKNVPEVIYQFRLYPDGRSCFPYASKGIENIYEVTPKEVIEDATMAFNNIYEDDLNLLKESIAYSAQTMQEWNLEYRVDLPKRGVRWVHGKSKPEKLEDGSVLWHGVIKDITEQVETKQKLQIQSELLKEKKKELETIIQEAPHPMVLHVQGGEVLMLNQAWSDSSGFTFEEIPTINDWVKKVYDKDHASIVEKHIETLYDITQKVDEGEFTFLNKNKKYLTWQVSSSPLGLINGKKAIITSAMDITEIKEKERILLQQSKMAAMGEMIGNIAHQWRQSLSTISTVATGTKLQKELNVLNDEDIIHNMDIINNSSQYLSKTIDDFRNFFKPSYKSSEQFSISVIIKKALKLIQSQFSSKDIEIINNSEEVFIESMENELIQVLINILNNSRDALLNTEEQKRYIFINSYEKEGYLFIKIKDNANGIPENIINRVFEPYFTTKHQSQGTGIGLYMSEEIVRVHLNGILEVKNTSFIYKDINYTGALFTIKIPLD